MASVHRRPFGGRSFDGASLLSIWAFALMLVPATLVVGPLGAAGSPAQLLGLLAGAWWLGAQLERSQVARTPTQPVRRAMASFSFAVLISYAVAALRPIDAVELRAADRGVLLVISWFGIMLLTTDGVSSRARLDDVLRWLVLLGAVCATLGIVQFFTGVAFVDSISIPGLSSNSELTGVYNRNGFARAAGTSTHPIEFGVMLAMILPISLHYALVETIRSIFSRWFPVFVIAVAIPITISRSAMIGIIVVLAIVFPAWPVGRRRIGYAAIATVLVVVYVVVPGLLGTLLRLFTGVATDDSARSRTDSYELAWSFIEQNPFFGRGFSTFLPSYRILDNQYLGLIIETGFVGLFAFLGVILTGILVGTKVMRTSANPGVTSLSRSLVAAITAAACAYATFDGFGFPQVAGLTFFFLGCIGALRRLSVADQTEYAGSREATPFLPASL